jgi:hypothetical protein
VDAEVARVAAPPVVDVVLASGCSGAPFHGGVLAAVLPVTFGWVVFRRL